MRVAKVAAKSEQEAGGLAISSVILNIKSKWRSEKH